MIKLDKINSELTTQQDGFRRIKLGISLVVLKFIHYFSIFLAGGLGVGGAIVQASHLKAKEAPSKPTLTAIKVLALISLIAIALLWLSGLSLAYLKYGTILLGTFFFIKLFGAGLILIGATLFSLVFRGYGGDELVQSLFLNMPGGKLAAMLVVMLVIFLLGFILDFIEITFVVVPIVAPILLMLGFDPIWLGIMIAINLQTSFLTPPFGFALFYLRGVAPSSIATATMYRGVLPFIFIQLLVLCLIAQWPQIVTWLPEQIYN